MVHQEIIDRHNELLKSNGAASIKGVITEIVNTFKTNLPWLNINGYTYYVRQQKEAPDTIMTNNDDQCTSNLSGLTSNWQCDISINLNHIEISDINN
jgi:hypothetical protein